MKHNYKTYGTCTKVINFELNGDKVTNVEFVGGCPGNTEAVSRLVEGMTVSEINEKLAGIKCGRKPTSCPDQLSKAVNLAYEEENNA